MGKWWAIFLVGLRSKLKGKYGLDKILTLLRRSYMMKFSKMTASSQFYPLKTDLSHFLVED